MTYLAFIDEIGRTTDGKYLYRFDFTDDTDVVWGDFFNVVPASIVPILTPDKNCLTMTARAAFPQQMEIAAKNHCFSIQDCIDGILPLMFSEISDETIQYEDKPFFLQFGEEFEEVEKKLKGIGLEFFDVEEIEKGDESAIDNLINSIDGEVEE